jgi:hypothetical protein
MSEADLLDLRQTVNSKDPFVVLSENPSRLFELARVLVRFDHVARFIVNANHSAM